MATILLIEDDENLRYGLRFNLEREGHRVLDGGTAEAGVELAGRERIDLAVLDVMLPGMSGVDLLARLRKHHPPFPVLMLTARAGESEAVAALRLGADDYVRKPFGLAELLARIDVLLRRSHRSPEDREPVTVGPWRIDLASRIARRDGGEFTLTATEADLIATLIESDEPVSREKLLARVWGVGSRTPTRTLDNHVARLRKKIEERPEAPEILITVHGHGYRLVR